MWKLGTGCLSLIHQMGRVKVTVRATQGWWWRAAPSAAAAAAHVLPKTTDFTGAESPERTRCNLSVLSLWCGQVGVERPAQGHWMWAWKCDLGEGGGVAWSPQSTNRCPQWARLLAHPCVSPVCTRRLCGDRSLITFNYPTCFLPIVYTGPEHICLRSSKSSRPEPLPMQNLFSSLYWWNCKIRFSTCAQESRIQKTNEQKKTTKREKQSEEEKNFHLPELLAECHHTFIILPSTSSRALGKKKSP